MAANDLADEPQQMLLRPEATRDGLPEGQRRTSSATRWTWVRSMRATTRMARAAHRRRKWIAELRNVLGLRQFSLRGLHRVRAECKRVCLALNLRRTVVFSASSAKT